MANVVLTRALAIGERVEDIFRDFRTAQVPQSARRGAAVRVLATASGIDVFSECFVGERPVLERSELSAANRTPLDPDDELIPPEPGVPLERVVMSADNQSGAARIIFVRLIIREL